MPYSHSSGTLSSRSLGGCLRYPASSCSSFGHPGHCHPSHGHHGHHGHSHGYPSHGYQGHGYPGSVAYTQGPCQQGSPAYGCQETCWEPASYQEPCPGRRSSSLCRPLQAACPGSSGCGSAGLGPFGYGGSRPQALGCGTGYCRPTYFSSSRTYQGAAFPPACSSGCYGQTY